MDPIATNPTALRQILKRSGGRMENRARGLTECCNLPHPTIHPTNVSESVPFSLTGFQWSSDSKAGSCNYGTGCDTLTTSWDTFKPSHNPLVAGSNPAGPTRSGHVLTLVTSRNTQHSRQSDCGVSECAPWRDATFAIMWFSARVTFGL